MKIRRGFVSNSSSSSFVVAWAKKPESEEEIRKALFGNETEYPNPFTWDNTPSNFSATTIAQWLMSSLKWDEKEVRESLEDDIGAYFSYLLSQAAEKYRNSFTIENGKEVSCLTLAQREVKKSIGLLNKNYPRIKWQARIDAVVAHRRKWHLISEDLNKKLGNLAKKLRKKHGCVDLPWQDSSKMTAEEKAVYEAARKKSYEEFQEKVLKDPTYVKLNEKRRKACLRSWNEPKKVAETTKLVANRLADIFYKEHPGAVFSVVEISDDSSMGSAMEHGDLFTKLPHKRFSHH